MSTAAELPAVAKFESTLLILFIPSVDRDMNPLDQLQWETAALEVLGRGLGGATALPRGRGVWRDDAQGGKLIFDNPIAIHCYTNAEALTGFQPELHAFLARMGTETRQGAVGFVIDKTYMEIRFPLVIPE